MRSPLAPGRLTALAVALCLITASAPARATAAAPRAVHVAAAPASPERRPLPLRFEENVGQTDARVRFVARGASAAAFLTPEAAVLRFRTAEKTGDVAIALRLDGAARDAELVGEDELPGRSNYFVGNDPSRWRRGVRAYASVRARGVLPGVDVVYYGDERGLEYDLVVAPGADPGRVRIAVDGASGVRVDDAGDLMITAGTTEIVHRRPTVYQRAADGTRRPVAGRYRAIDAATVGVDVGEYDPSRPLIVDPVVVFATSLGGTFADSAAAVATDAAGDVFVAGSTAALDFPAEAGQPVGAGGGTDAFVTKLDPSGTSVIFSTYVGGNGDDAALGLAISPSGFVWIAGRTGSSDLPVSFGAQSTLGGTQPTAVDGFAARLNAFGADVDACTYIGGPGVDEARGIAIDPSGAVYVTGVTDGFSIVTAPGYEQVFNGGTDAFVAKFEVGSVRLAYRTYLGGASFDAGNAIAVDALGSAYVVGSYTGDVDPAFPTTDGAQPQFGGVEDAFVAKLSPSGRDLLYSTSLGGRDADAAYGVAIDATGAAYVTGETSSYDFPTAGSARPRLDDGADAFLTKLSPSGSSFVYSACFGGTGDDAGRAVAVDAAGRAAVAGETRSTDFPVLGAVQPSLAGSSDGFVSTASPSGEIVSSTYLGGDAADSCAGVAIDRTGAITAVGLTWSAGFPGGGQLGARGVSDAFVFKLYADGPGTAPEAPAGASATALSSASVRVSWTDASASETCFKVERRREAAAAWTQVGVAAADATSFTDVGLDAGTLYHYRVRASDGPDDSAPSDEADVTTPAATAVPTSPIQATARAAGLSRVAVEWLDMSATETGFEVERRAGSAAFAPVGSTGPDANRFVDTTVPGASSYTYRVRAVNAFGGSGYSQTNAVTVTAAALAPPTNLRTTPTAAASVRLAWTDASSGEAGFEIERKTGADGVWSLVGTAPANATGFTDARLTAGVTYVYRVTATRGSERSAPSAEVSGTTPRVGTPGTPFVTGGSATRVDLGFTATGTVLTAGFLLERKTGLGGTYAQVGSRIFSSFYSDTGLQPNTVYVYRVRAFAGNETDGYVESAYSPERVVTTLTAPPAGATIVVTSAADADARDDAMTLREAILVVDGTLSVGSLTPAEQALVTGVPSPQSSNRIAFAVGGGGAQTIALAGALPTVTGSVTIDATTQPGYAGAPLVELSGAGAGAGVSGLAIAAPDVAVRGLAIGQFSADGVSASNAPRAAVEACYVGTDPTGTLARGNGGDGIRLVACDGASVRGCVLSANGAAGLAISGSRGLLVAANRVGTDASGTAALGNGVGVDLEDVGPSSNQSAFVGGVSAADGNIVSGNLGAGVVVVGFNVLVAENVVGLDATGTRAVGNGGAGVTLSGNDQWLEGGAVSGNGGAGVVVIGDRHRVDGCFVGTNASATAAIGNGGDGVLVTGYNNTIGPLPGGPANVIAGNAGHGVHVSTGDPFGDFGNVTLGNFVGTNSAGMADLGNGGDGVRIDGGQSNAVGQPESRSRNVIAFNRGNGVTVLAGASHALRWNTIYANAGLGIDLGGDGPTPNDSGDGDGGANDLQNAPVLSSAVYHPTYATTLAVSGTLDAQPSKSYAIDLYAERPAAAGGASLLGTLVAFTDASGHAAFALDVVAGVANGTPVVATASSVDINHAVLDTSELSAPVLVAGRRIGSDTVGVYAGETGVFFAKNANAAGAADLLFGYGPAGAALVALSGDWDGDGTDTPGVYDPSTSAFFLRNSSSPGPADFAFVFGAAGAGVVPLVGDWNGDGVDTVGFYVPSTGVFFLTNTNASGPADSVFTYGAPSSGVVPLAGDWTGGGFDSVGLYQPATGAFFLRNSLSQGSASIVFTFGSASAGLVPVAGDWNGDGVDSVGLYLPATGTWFLKNANRAGAADALFAYGPPGLVPVVGDWDGL